MKLVITESQSERLTEQLKDRAKEWASDKLMKGGEKVLGSKGGKKVVGGASDIMQKQAMDNLTKKMEFSPEAMKDFNIDFEKDAPTLSKFMAKLASLRGVAKTKVSSPLSPKPAETTPSPHPGGVANYEPSKKEKRKSEESSKEKVKVPKNLTVTELGRYMMHPLGGKVKITSGFGGRDIEFGSKDHKGVDLRVNSGSPVYAPLDGVVTRSEDTSGYNPCGGHVRIDHGKLQTKFCHLSNIVVAKGSNVKRGQIIGYSGGGENDPGRGRSTGAHLHYEILDTNNKALDPVLIEPNLR